MPAPDKALEAKMAARCAYESFFPESADDDGPERFIIEAALEQEIFEDMNHSSSEDDSEISSPKNFYKPKPAKRPRPATQPTPYPDETLKSLVAPVSPPRRTSRKRRRLDPHGQILRGLGDTIECKEGPELANTEAKAQISYVKDQLKTWVERFKRVIEEDGPKRPLLSIDRFADLFRRNQIPHGHHFVIHQHDHPVAGLHYDLRLQISESSSVSFAIMYGLPGNPNSKRLNRNATEARVHNLWNHLIENASFSSGSLLIWDIGEYSVLPYRQKGEETDNERSAESNGEASASLPNLSESQKLHEAFQQRKIRICLNGTRLPPGYTFILRLQSSNNRYAQPEKPAHKRQRKDTRNLMTKSDPTSDIEDPPELSDELIPNASMALDPQASNYELELAERESERVRLTNAYPGATNSINSIHQRIWYLSMDRLASGFVPSSDKDGTKVWVRKQEGDDLAGFEPFFVKGKEVERSVVTGRLSAEILHDEGVEGYVGRKGWRPVLE